MSAGYSGTPLVKKLGIKAGRTLAFLHVPDSYQSLLGDLPADLSIYDSLPSEAQSLDFIHAFYRSRADLDDAFSHLKQAMKYDGVLWISWTKKSSGIVSDLNENVVREIGLHHGLVDVKVAAIDSIWSGLKFMYRREDRP